MGYVFDLINQFSDIITEAIRNKDNLRVKDYAIDRIGEAIILTVIADSPESAENIEKLIVKFISRLLGGKNATS